MLYCRNFLTFIVVEACSLDTCADRSAPELSFFACHTPALWHQYNKFVLLKKIVSKKIHVDTISEESYTDRYLTGGGWSSSQACRFSYM